MLDDAIPVLLQCRPNPCRLDYKYPAFHHHHHVARRQTVPIFAKALPKQAFQGVALHCFWNLFASYRKSEARTVTVFFADQDGDTCVAAANIVLKNLLEIDRPR